MGTLWRRRGAFFCLLFVYTGFAFTFLTGTARLILLVVAAFSFALSFLFRKKHTEKHLFLKKALPLLRIGLCACMLSLVFFGTYQHFVIDRTVEKWNTRTCTVTGTVLEKVSATSYSASYKADILTEDEDSLCILLTAPSDILSPGDTVTCTVTFSAFEKYNGAFPEKQYYSSIGAVLKGETDYVTVNGKKTSLRTRISTWSDSLSGMLRADLGRDGSALASALFLGDRSDLPASLTRDFRRLGISHMLAISGLHFTVLLAGADKLLSVFTQRRRLRAVILVFADIGYMLLCGMTDSILRAGIMMLFCYGALFFNRQPDMFSSLGVASFLMCIFAPSSIYSVALQLSVTSVLALYVTEQIRQKTRTEEPPSRLRRTVQRCIEALLLPMVVQAVLLPLLCLYFGEFSLLTPFANILFSPIIQAVLILTPIYLLLRILAPIAAVLALLIRGLSAFTVFLSEEMASVRGITVSLHYSFAPLFALVLSGLILCTPLCKNKKQLRRHLAGTCAVILLFSACILISNTLTRDQVTVLSTAKGKNDAIVIRAGSDTMLIDISDGSFGALASAYSEAASDGATEIDTLLLTHLHKRHITGVTQLSDTAYIRALILPDPETDTEMTVFDELTKLCREESIPLYTYADSDIVQWGENVEILPEERLYLSRSTHPIIALRIRANDAVFSYLGSSATEIAAYREQDDADAIVFGGHGPIVKKAITVNVSPHLCAAMLRPNAGSLSDEVQGNLPADSTIFSDAEAFKYIFLP